VPKTRALKSQAPKARRRKREREREREKRERDVTNSKSLHHDSLPISIPWVEKGICSKQKTRRACFVAFVVMVGYCLLFVGEVSIFIYKRNGCLL
jgi:hypothetical protein